MKHLHFVQSLEPLQGGGLGRAALDLHLALRAKEPSRLLATRGADFSLDWPGVLQGVRRGVAKTYYAPAIARAAAEEVAAADVVHGHGFYTALNWSVGGEAVRQKRPLVYHAQGFFDPWILRRSRVKKGLARWLFEEANFRHVGLWRALTSKEADQIRLQRGTSNIIVLPNGIDVEPRREPRTSPASETRTLLFLGRIHPKKGIDLLLQAWARLGPERKQWRLKIAGPDEGGYAATVREIVAREGLGGSVEILGALVGEEKRGAFRAADAFVLTSYSEGMPLAVLEAMAADLPVIITDECNLPEAGEAGAGWVCRPEFASVVDAMRAAFTADAAELRQRGDAGRQLVLRKFQWPAIAAELRAACAGLL